MKFRLEPKKLGKLLSELRQKAGLSQAKISKVCEVNSPQYISNIERGQCLPSLKILKTMLSEYKASETDKNQLIDLFIESAKTEVEDIFSIELKLNYNTNHEKMNASYLDSPTLSYSMSAKNDY